MIGLPLLIAAVAACPTSPDGSQLALRYETFDTGSGGNAWRSLLSRGCVDTAVATLAAYQQANAARMTDAQRTELHFHMGQALSMSSRDSEAVPHFQQAVSDESSPEWKAYVQAHLGFARKDRAQVEQAVADYEKAAKPGSMRLSVVRGFLKCLDRPYMEAAHCAM